MASVDNAVANYRPAGGTRNNPMLAGALLAFGLAASCAVAMWNSALGTALALLLAFGVIAAGLTAREVRRWGHRGLLSPLSLYAVFWFAFIALPLPIAIITSGGVGGARASPSALNLAGAVALGSLLLITGSYEFGSRVRWGDGLREPRLNLPAVLVMAAVGWGIRAYLIATGAFGYLGFGQAVEVNSGQTLLNLASSLAPLSTGAIGYLHWRQSGRRPHLRALLWAAMSVTVALSLMSGLKGQVVTDLIPLAVVYICVRRRIPWRQALVTVAYLALILPGVQDLRADIASGRTTTGSGIVGTARAVSERVIDGYSSRSVGDHMVSLYIHVRDEYKVIPDNLALILSRTGGDIPYLGATRILLEPIPVVPINVANGGPFVVGQYVNVAYRDGPLTSSTPATQPGDLYMSAGWPAVVLGEIIVGLSLGLIWSFVARRNQPWVLVWYSGMAVFLANAGKEYGLLMRSLLQRGIGTWLALLAFAFVGRQLQLRAQIRS